MLALVAICTINIAVVSAQTSNASLNPVFTHIAKLANAKVSYVFDIDHTPKERKEHGEITLDYKATDTLKAYYNNANGKMEWSMIIKKTGSTWTVDDPQAQTKLEMVYNFLKQNACIENVDWVTVYEWQKID